MDERKKGFAQIQALLDVVTEGMVAEEYLDLLEQLASEIEIRIMAAQDDVAEGGG